MPFSAQVTLAGLPAAVHHDPPFRRVDVVDEPGVRTVAALLRAAWDAEPPATAASLFAAGSDDSAADAEARTTAREEAVWDFMREYSHLTEEQRVALPRNPDTQDAQIPWRQTIYGIWRHVFGDTAAFVWQANARAGHWHEDFAARHGGDASIGELVLQHGQQGEHAVKHVFKHNVLLCPAYFGEGMNIRVERLPARTTPTAIGTADGEGEGETYVLEDRVDLDTYTNDSGTIVWWIRRGVPVQFHVEPLDEAEGGNPERKDLAAVLVYGNLCVVCDLDAEYAEEEKKAANENGQE